MTQRRPLVIAAVALAALLAAAVAVTVSGNATAAGGAGAQPRPFRHVSHQSLACGECHAVGARHRVSRIWTAEVCAACHHDPARGLSCARCHAPASYEAPRVVQLPVTLSMREQPLVRPSEFDHTRHAGFDCVQCHRPEAGVRLPPPACSSCHAEHHAGGAECSACHVPAPAGVHDLQVHLTCAGSGCHSPADDRQPPLSRPMCLYCHEPQRDHEPDGLCWDCHQVPYRGAPPP